ncbi:MAG: glycosyltransferase [Candidatus Dormibacteraeota bacterium]|uniref:Glycosyltransferase n=1 Tax=Candidatus Amunia macphersoniae TaxID=3127014 RepID=A0A934KB60_9BACT|nr:glycosyltransferase [Candidatus Dormibacteraeota bacterium]
MTPPSDVSVVVPTFKRAASLRRLLTSIEASVVPPGGLEVIVVGYEADAAREVVGSFTNAKYIVQSGSGPADAREAGWRAAAGSRIVFVDDDCVVSPTAITILAAALDHADGVGAGIEPLGRDSLIADFAHADGVVDHRLVKGQIQWLVTAGVAFRRDALEGVGGFQKYRYGEDTDLTLRLLATNRELRVEPSARIYHDHRTRLGQLFTSYYRRGTCERRLMGAYPNHRAAKRRAARDLLDPRSWVATYRRYAREVSAPRSVLFVVLKAVLIVPYVAGTIVGERSIERRQAAR